MKRIAEKQKELLIKKRKGEKMESVKNKRNGEHRKKQ